MVLSAFTATMHNVPWRDNQLAYFTVALPRWVLERSSSPRGGFSRLTLPREAVTTLCFLRAPPKKRMARIVMTLWTRLALSWTMKTMMTTITTITMRMGEMTVKVMAQTPAAGIHWTHRAQRLALLLVLSPNPVRRALRLPHPRPSLERA